MDSKTALFVGAAAALVAAPAFAAPAIDQAPAVPPASSYAELLQPISNPLERLRLSDAQAQAQPARLIEAQFVEHHHHHHHTRLWFRRNGYIWNGGAWVLRPVYHHHHHHHHHSRIWYQRNGYVWDNGGWVLRPAYHHHNNY